MTVKNKRKRLRGTHNNKRFISIRAVRALAFFHLKKTLKSLHFRCKNTFKVVDNSVDNFRVSVGF